MENSMERTILGGGKEFDFSFEIQLLEKYPHGFVSEVGIRTRNEYFWNWQPENDH